MTREQALNYLVSTGLTEEQVMEVVEGLRQEPKTGHWINNQNGTFECDQCGCKHSKSRFCPDCGAKM